MVVTASSVLITLWLFPFCMLVISFLRSLGVCVVLAFVAGFTFAFSVCLVLLLPGVIVLLMRCVDALILLP